MKALVRCAIYTRKSSEEGLEQDFNSLAAQREACEAYIKSQAGEGWKLSTKLYDDGGYSGGTMERPALRALLADIDAGVVDVIVVYKVDRLTRALNDFSRIVEKLDAKRASFVSVTQAFNTTTSMGRLTLNVLLSFAQFEREVTGERIRDKIAASKKKGMWMGARAPLGYVNDARSLAINEGEANLVRTIFERFLVLHSTARLAEVLADEGVRSKRYHTKDGRVLGGARFSPGALRYLLSNRTYLGEVRHREKWFPGLQPPIVGVEIFEAAQRFLGAKLQRRAVEARPSGAPLRGLVFDDAGGAMSPSHARGRNGARHHYYVSQALKRPEGRREGSRQRVHAGWLESQVMAISARVFGVAGGWEVVLPRLRRVLVEQKAITIEAKLADLNAELCCARLSPCERLVFEGDCARLAFRVDPRLWRGRYKAFDENGGRLFTGEPDRSLLSAVATAHAWRRKWTRGVTLAAIAEQEGVDLSNLLRKARLAYLAPDIVRALASGQSQVAHSVRELTQRSLPLDWELQRRLVFAGAGARRFRG